MIARFGAAVAVLAVAVFGATAKADDAACVVAYAEVQPASINAARAAPRQYRNAGVKDRGNIRHYVLQQRNRPDHLTLVEVWHSPQALEAHEGAAHTRKFRDDALPMSGTLYDQRLYRLVN